MIVKNWRGGMKMWKIIGAILILIVIAILALAIYFKERVVSSNL